MREILEERLAELRTQIDEGQQQLAALERRKQELQTTLYRISGAVQVLEEILHQADASTAENNGVHQVLQSEDA